MLLHQTDSTGNSTTDVSAGWCKGGDTDHGEQIIPMVCGRSLYLMVVFYVLLFFVVRKSTTCRYDMRDYSTIAIESVTQ